MSACDAIRFESAFASEKSMIEDRGSRIAIFDLPFSIFAFIAAPFRSRLPAGTSALRR
jgi:hypothetical protein